MSDPLFPKHAEGEDTAGVFAQVGLTGAEPTVADMLDRLAREKAASRAVAHGDQERAANNPDGDW